MTVAQEIEYLKTQLSSNQKQYARCVEDKDTMAMHYLELRNRELIDRLNRLEDNKRILPSDNRRDYTRIS